MILDQALHVAQTFDLADVILAGIDAALVGVHTSRPGKIVLYDAARQSASVQATVRSAYTTETGERVSEALALIPGVPVMHIGGGGFRTTYPVAAGDSCLLVFADCSLDRWLSQGGNDVDPEDDRHHCPSDAIAIVGLRDFRNALKHAPADHMSIGHDAGTTIELYRDEVRLGGEGARGDVVVQAALDDLGLALQAASDALAAAGAAAAPSKAAVDAIRTALQALNGGRGWLARTSKVKAE